MLENKLGRPRIEVDFEEVNKLSEILCTASEISHVLGVSEDTLSRRTQELFQMTFAEYIKKASSGGRISLRRAQFHKALSGSVPMLIFLGKQYLGQTDNPIEAEAHKTITLAYRLHE